MDATKSIMQEIVPDLPLNKNNNTTNTNTEPNNELKFQLREDTGHLIHHPSPITIGADLLIELKGETMDTTEWLIPVHKCFLKSQVPFFEAMFNREGFWKETQNADVIEGVSKLKINVPSKNVSNKTVRTFFDILYCDFICNKSNFRNVFNNSQGYCDSCNVFELIELSEFWMVDRIKEAALEYSTRSMNSSMMMKAYDYDNPSVRKAMKPICDLHIKRMTVVANSGNTAAKRLYHAFTKVHATMNDIKVVGTNQDLVRSATKVKKDLNDITAEMDEDIKSYNKNLGHNGLFNGCLKVLKRKYAPGGMDPVV